MAEELKGKATGKGIKAFHQRLAQMEQEVTELFARMEASEEAGKITQEQRLEVEKQILNLKIREFVKIIDVNEKEGKRSAR